jgi:hypothetical protein
MSEIITRVCRKCKESKPLATFPLCRSGNSRSSKRKAKRTAQRPGWTCAACRKKWQQDRHQELRERVLRHYCGGEPHCQCPGCDVKEYVFLTIDHVGGGGCKHRRDDPIVRGGLVRWLIKNNLPAGYRVVCWNCNCAGRKWGNCCPVHEAGRAAQVDQPDRPAPRERLSSTVVSDHA